jgi:hypothetical protein
MYVFQGKGYEKKVGYYCGDRVEFRKGGIRQTLSNLMYYMMSGLSIRRPMKQTWMLNLATIWKDLHIPSPYLHNSKYVNASQVWKCKLIKSFGTIKWFKGGYILEQKTIEKFYYCRLIDFWDLHGTFPIVM